MAKYTFDKPTRDDELYMAEHMRKEDRRELVGMTGPNLLAEVEHCVRASERVWACHCDGVLLGLFGVICTNPMQRHGIIWMLATEHTTEHKMFTGRMTKRGLNAILQDWEYLYNWVDEGNNRTIAWLKWMGADVREAAPRGLYGFNYHFFSFTRRK